MQQNIGPILCSASIIDSTPNIALLDGRIVESFLLWFLITVVGFGSLYSFVGHAFVAHVAWSIG